MEARLRSKGIEPDLVDLEALLDPTLTYAENREIVAETLKQPLDSGQAYLRYWMDRSRGEEPEEAEDMILPSPPEFYLEQDGTIGVATIEEGRIEYRNWGELIEPEQKECLGFLPPKALDSDLKPHKIPWLLPQRPQEGPEQEDLWTEVLRFVHEHADISPPYGGTFASLIAASWLPERLPCAPRLVLLGDTESGKTRVLDIFKLLGHKALPVTLPTPATYYRIIDAHGPLTLLIDEFQSLHSDARREMEALLRTGFQKDQYVPRTAESGRVEFFQTYGFAAVASRHNLPDDILNRAIVITMIESQRKDLARRMDTDWAEAIRCRLFDFRLQVLAGKVALPIEEADEQALRPVEVEMNPFRRTISLRSRELEIASTLLATTLTFTDDEDCLQAVARTQLRSQAEIAEGLDAKVFYAIQALVAGLLTPKLGEPLTLKEAGRGLIVMQDVADQLNRDETPKKPFTPKKVGSVIRGTLGFETAKNRRGYFAIDDGEFSDKYGRLKAKYGDRTWGQREEED